MTFALLVGFGAAPAAGASEVTIPSVAVATAGADVVVSGVVVGWGAPPPTSDVRPPGTARLTLRVTERLKGEGRDTLEIVGAGPHWAPGTPAVVFGRYEPVASVCGPDPATGVVSRSSELRLTHLVAGPPAEWVLADRRFGVVRDAETLLREIRAQAGQSDHGGEVAVRVPATSPLARDDGVPVYLLLPADAGTEAFVLSWLADPDPARQAAGIAALRRFESTAHIERLLALVERPDAVGEAARGVLEAWSVPHPVGTSPSR